MATIVDYWPDAFKKLYGGKWPTTYCCVDTETSGYSPTGDVVIEWGHCLVEDGKVVDRLSLVIDWTGRDDPSDMFLRNRLAKLQAGFASRNKTCHVSYQLMQSGMKPAAAFAFIRQFTDRLKARSVPFVLHNMLFDEKMLSGNSLLLGEKGFTFGDLVFDTSAIEKANQMLNNERCHPRVKDTLREYFTRVNYTRAKGVKSNLDEHCFEKYGLASQAGITTQDMHGAKTDAFCCHLLMQAFGRGIGEPKKAMTFAPVGQIADRLVEAPTITGGSTKLKRIRGQRRS